MGRGAMGGYCVKATHKGGASKPPGLAAREPPVKHRTPFAGKACHVYVSWWLERQGVRGETFRGRVFFEGQGLPRLQNDHVLVP